MKGWRTRVLQSEVLYSRRRHAAISMLSRNYVAYGAAAIASIGVASGTAAVHANLFPVPQIVYVITTSGTCFLAMALVALLVRDIAFGSSATLRLLALVALTAGLFAAVRTGPVGFARHDEIYSWNMWAIQHYLGQPVDQTYTGAPYPQLFPYWLASIYHAQGGYVCQTLARLMTLIPLLVVLVIPLNFFRENMGRKAMRVSALAYLGMLISIYPNMQWGYADPLFTAAFGVSVALLLASVEKPDGASLVGLASAAGAMAAMTKQPGLLWCCLGMPMVVGFGVATRLWPRKALWPVGTAMLLALSWPLWFGAGFSGNMGVIGRSLGERGYLEVFGQSAYAYLWRRPAVGLLLAGSLAVAWRMKTMRGIWLAAVLLPLLAWFVFGSYEFRLGMHVVVACALMVAFALGCAQPRRELAENAAAVPSRALSLGGRLWVGLITAILAFGTIAIWWSGARRSPDGQRQVFIQQVGEGAGPLFDRIVSSQSRVYVTSNYTYGALFGRVPLIRPQQDGKVATPDLVRTQLVHAGADFAVVAGSFAFGSQSAALERLGLKCPLALQPSISASSRTEFKVYSVDLGSLRDCSLDE